MCQCFCSWQGEAVHFCQNICCDEAWSLTLPHPAERSWWRSDCRCCQHCKLIPLQVPGGQPSLAGSRCTLPPGGSLPLCRPRPLAQQGVSFQPPNWQQRTKHTRSPTNTNSCLKTLVNGSFPAEVFRRLRVFINVFSVYHKGIIVCYISDTFIYLSSRLVGVFLNVIS